MVVNPLVSFGLLALGYGVALVCRRRGRFSRWNFVLLTLAAWFTVVVIFSVFAVTAVVLKS